ncbi:hypothetical protein ATOP_00900 [Granulimonas faecalis]|uniref:Uncharacterized protein n=1 Tax=Granulimonas faecalis TaxID=2894155 RepID=A0AAV5B1Q7_9ACTN|nr:hypothetical protein ATOP_00900 [Granulimonas faecalis]
MDAILTMLSMLGLDEQLGGGEKSASIRRITRPAATRRRFLENDAMGAVSLLRAIARGLPPCLKAVEGALNGFQARGVTRLSV